MSSCGGAARHCIGIAATAVLSVTGSGQASASITIAVDGVSELITTPPTFQVPVVSVTVPG